MQVFGDGFDLYATLADIGTYWDAGSSGGSGTLQAGRFSGSRAYQTNTGTGSTGMTKTSGANDAVHHFVFAFDKINTISAGTGIGTYISLIDGSTTQCSIGFRQDGAMVLFSGSAPTSGGTPLAIYTGALTASNVWYAFEVEVVINSTTGSFTVRKNGNTGTPDFTLGSLNTRVSANNYASKIQIGCANGTQEVIDDFLWRSDPTSVPWVGDIRCYTRMPASDVQAQFSKSPATATQQNPSQNPGLNLQAGQPYYTPYTANYSGTIGLATVYLQGSYTGNMKCSVFSSVGGAPAAVLGSATPISNPTAATNTFTFPTPVPVVKGTQYWIGFCSDTFLSGGWNMGASGPGGYSTTAYASFPVASPAFTGGTYTVTSSIIITPTNSTLVSEAQQDGTTSYVYDSNIGDNDLYTIAASATTPQSTVCVTTRGFFEKSDAGTRGAAVQLKSGGTTVQSTSTALNTVWGWLWRTDLTDPNTSAAWTATAVNNVQVGPICTA